MRFESIAPLLLGALVGCGSPQSDGPRSASNATSSASETTSLTTRAPPPGPSVSVVAAFDPASGELPEGVATKDGYAYVGFAPTGEVAKVDLRTGERSKFASLPRPVANKGFMTGLAFGPDGALYAALVSFDPSVQPGVYRVGQAGGDAALFAKDPKMVFPNGLVFDGRGDLFVTDSAAGTIFKANRKGAVTTWVSGAVLEGDPAQCGGSGNPFAIGANGLVEREGAFFATNTDKGSVVRIDVRSDGAAATPTIAAGPDCAALSGADGLAVDARGDFVVAVNRQNKVVRIARGGAVETIAAGSPVEFPASIAWNGPAMITTSFALANAATGKPAKPALLRIATGR